MLRERGKLYSLDNTIRRDNRVAYGRKGGFSGSEFPKLRLSLPLIFGLDVLASALLMVAILVVVHKKGLRGFGGIAIGGIVGLEIFFLASISGASMNPARSLAPALFSGVLANLWLYWSATFVGTAIIAAAYRKKLCQ
jgi:glycerol uptake facilitator-like aquaporin